LGKRERPKEDTPNHGKHGGICARAERQQRDGDQGEPGTAENIADRERQVRAAHAPFDEGEA
jgi:hypothetical protein